MGARIGENMRKFILTLCFLFIASTTLAGTRVFYNGENVTRISNGSPASGALYYNDDSPDYTAKIALINSVPRKFLKVIAGELLERTQAEKDAILQAETDARQLAQDNADNELRVTLKEAFTAWLQLYNSKVPVQYKVTKDEMVTQIKSNRTP